MEDIDRDSEDPNRYLVDFDVPSQFIAKLGNDPGNSADEFKVGNIQNINFSWLSQIGCLIEIGNQFIKGNRKSDPPSGTHILTAHVFFLLNEEPVYGLIFFFS